MAWGALSAVLFPAWRERGRSPVHPWGCRHRSPPLVVLWCTGQGHLLQVGEVPLARWEEEAEGLTQPHCVLTACATRTPL
jgi:hypothetical protein